MRSNLSAARATLRELKRIGRVEKIDEARVQAFLSMAEALDSDPSNAALWRQYREVLEGLTADDGGESVDKALEDLFGPVRDSSAS